MYLWRLIVRRWWLIALPTIIAFIVTIPSLRAIISPPASFNTAIRFTASAEPCSGGSGTFQDCAYTPWLASEYTVNNLASWVNTDSFASEVSKQAASQGSLTISPDQLRGLIRSDSARSIMTLYLGAWPDANQLQQIGQACSFVLQNKAGDYWPQTGGKKLDVVALDDVVVTSAVPPLTQRLAPLARIGIGLAFGIILAFLVEYLDRSLHSRTEIEALGLAVIAEIPGHRL